jgi:hypothetical protein
MSQVHYLTIYKLYFFDIYKLKTIMKEFIKKNFVVIVLVISLLSFFKGCSDSRELTKIKNEIKAIKDSTYTKTELDAELKISGLEAEKRMIQATDRKLLDVRRQTEIEEEIKLLNNKK